MERLVITLIGQDRTGLVEALSAAIFEHGGNWEQSQLAELEGKFAGVVVASVSKAKAPSLTKALETIERKGLLHITVESGHSSETKPVSKTIELELVGQDHPGIVHEISNALAQAGVNVEEFSSEVLPAPMGGSLFQAKAILSIADDADSDQIQNVLEALAQDLMVDLTLVPEA